MALLTDDILHDDAIEIEVAVTVNERPAHDPACQELGLLLVAQGRDREVVTRLREIIGLPEEFEIRIGLAEARKADASPTVIEPGDVTDLVVRAQDCVECSAYSWSKGCSSWPW